MGRKHSRKRRNCLLRAIFHFPQCFQKTCTADTLKPGLVWERVELVVFVCLYLPAHCFYAFLKSCLVCMQYFDPFPDNCMNGTLFFILEFQKNVSKNYTLTLSQTSPGSVFTNHSQEHSLSLSPRFANLNVTQLLIG